ncbi:twin-arginine translocation signal domain-containing protein [Thermogemmatispora carboxidivorans]|uniref:twin-arginine translocation signal domain-containing protein n=1 Tax=Thermogemmatispora carboxidivorans TaxID=1382306 RepID=UPI00138E0272|nr:twin-arginine translocation signal domain-containing protein [Thermogemmatispora carboxidivorans]
MPRMTRRSFLKRTSVGVATGSALVGAFAVAQPVEAQPAAAGVVGADRAAAPDLASVSENAEPLVLHVRQRSTGEVSILTGTREITYRDPQLVAHLLKRAAQP